MRKLLLVLPLLMSLSLFAQKKEGIHKGLIRVQGTVGLGISKMEMRYYVLGELEGCISDHLGIAKQIACLPPFSTAFRPRRGGEGASAMTAQSCP